MSFEYKWLNNNCICTFTKGINLPVLIDSSNYLVGHSDFDTIRFMVFDLRSVENYDIKEQDLKIISSLDSSASIWNDKICLAIVVVDTQGVKIAEDYINQMRDTKWKFGIFDRMEDALAWCSENKTKSFKP